MSKRHAPNEPINQARTNLGAVLQNLIIKKEESSPYTSDDPDGENDDEEDNHLQTLHSNGPLGDFALVGGQSSKKGQLSRSSATHLTSSSSSKKKRRRDDGMFGASASIQAPTGEHGQFQHTYIVKLFDRSVDLAQFDESAPLYPICRAWIENQPNNTSRQSVLPQQPAMPADETKCTESLTGPPPTDAQLKNPRIPEPLPLPPLQLFTDPLLDSGARPPAEQLLQDHMERWKLVRQRWKHAAQSYEAHCGRSLDHLKAVL